MDQRGEVVVIDGYPFSADDNFEGTMKTNLVVQHNGSILFVPPGILKSICPFNIASFPFVSGPGILFSVSFFSFIFRDIQNCTLKFGSWSFDESGLTLWPNLSTS